MPHTGIDRVLFLGLNATLHPVREVPPSVVAAGGGRVVLVGSVAGAVDVREGAVHSARQGRTRRLRRGAPAGTGRDGRGGDARRARPRRDGLLRPPRQAVPSFPPAPHPARPGRGRGLAGTPSPRARRRLHPHLAHLPSRVRALAPGVYRGLLNRFG
ncbi:hypothetical protein [Streptomyces sp. NPDC058625]|uniref:hypothetical protein n=1 Tax=Streptomyces sp. NPDC058625 TaxID=3346564 RepID=UPI0036580E86